MASDALLPYRANLLRHLDETAWLTKILYALGFAVLTAALAQVRVYAPWNPYVPYTGQVLGVLASGLVLGPEVGFASMGLYLLLGVGGLPVFADWSGGTAVLLGATGGYLLAYPPAAALAGYASRTHLRTADERTLRLITGAALGGLVVLFAAGSLLLGVAGVLATHGLGLTVLVSSVLVAAVAPVLWSWSRAESQAFLARMAAGLLAVLVIYALGWVGLALATGMTWSQALAAGVIQFVPVDLAKVFLAAGATGFLLPAVGELGSEPGPQA